MKWFLLFIIILTGCVEPNNPTNEKKPLPPEIILTFPSNNADSISLDEKIKVTFSEEILENTITDSSFRVFIDGNIEISGIFQISENKKEVTFIPNEPFIEGKEYFVYLSREIKDISGIPLSVNNTDGLYFFKFTTEITKPFITNSIPQNNAELNAEFNAFKVTFSEKMDINSLNNQTVFITEQQGSINYDDTTNSLTFIISEPFMPHQNYKFIITKEITDIYGIQADEDFIISFSIIE